MFRLSNPRITKRGVSHQGPILPEYTYILGTAPEDDEGAPIATSLNPSPSMSPTIPGIENPWWEAVEPEMASLHIKASSPMREGKR